MSKSSCSDPVSCIFMANTINIRVQGGSTEVRRDLWTYFYVFLSTQYPSKTWSIYFTHTMFRSRSQWPHDLTRGSAAVGFLEFGVQIPWGAWISLSCDVVVFLSGRLLCDGPIPCPEESYPVCVWVCVCVCVCHWVWLGATITIYTHEEVERPRLRKGEYLES